jgi:dethiobiotin synthetase
MRAELPAGASKLSAAEFTAMSAHAFDRNWVTSLLG